MDSMGTLESLMNMLAYGLNVVSWEGQGFAFNRRFQGRDCGRGKLGDKRRLTIPTFVMIKIWLYASNTIHTM